MKTAKSSKSAKAKKTTKSRGKQTRSATTLGKSTDLGILPPGGRVFAVAIGIDSYSPTSGLAPTPFANNDADGFIAAVKAIYPVETAATNLITDNLATRTEIEYTLRQYIENLTENDLFLFYYAGHGYHGEGGNRITVWDSKAHAVGETTLLLQSVLIDPLTKSPCNRAIAFIDACATPFKDGARTGLAKMDEGELKGFLSAAEYSAIFMSCKPGQKSYPDNTLKHGIWTSFLLKALRGEDDAALDDARLLTDRSLRDYLADVVPKYITRSTAHRSPQKPMAIVAATTTFAIRHVPQVAVVVGPEGDFSPIGFELKREYLQQIETGAIRSLPKFNKRNHFIDARVTAMTNGFVQGLIEPMVEEELQELYDEAKSVFGYRRDSLRREFGGGQGNLDAEAFRFWIESRQSDRDPTEYRYIRRLEIRSDDPADIEKLDEVFRAMFDQVVFHTSEFEIDLDKIVAHFENIKEAHGGELKDEAERMTYSTAAGLKIQIDPSARRIRLSWRSKQLPSAILSDARSIRFSLVGESRLLLGK